MNARPCRPARLHVRSCKDSERGRRLRWRFAGGTTEGRPALFGHRATWLPAAPRASSLRAIRRLDGRRPAGARRYSNPFANTVSETSTNTGVGLSALLSLPIWPYWFEPQHITRPALTTAQAWSEPTPIDCAPLVRPLTLTGTRLSEPDPSPSWPQPLLPQHFTPPAPVRAQVCA